MNLWMNIVYKEQKLLKGRHLLMWVKGIWRLAKMKLKEKDKKD